MSQYVLCTNILLAYLRRGRLQQYIEATYQLSAMALVPLISVVSEAEIHVLAWRNAWGEPKMQALEVMLDYLTVVPIPYRSNVAAYVHLDVYRRSQGVTIGKNDLWIAATALAEGATILTADQDFDHLHPHTLTHEYVDPTSHL